MRVEVISDGKTLERHEFICQPRAGESIQLKAGKFVVDDFCHNIRDGRLQVFCSPAVAESKPKRNQPAAT